MAVTVLPTPTFWAGEKVKETLPSELVVTSFLPIKVLPSLPEGLEKNLTMKVLWGLLLRLPLIVVWPPEVMEDICGVCRAAGPHKRKGRHQERDHDKAQCPSHGVAGPIRLGPSSLALAGEACALGLPRQQLMALVVDLGRVLL